MPHQQHEGEVKAADPEQSGAAACGGGCSRRALLECGAAAAALPALAPLASLASLAALASLNGCAPRIALPLAIEVGAPTAKGLVSVPLTRIPEILATGSSLLLHPDAVDDLGRPLSLLVVNSASDGLLAFDAFCPHSRCELAFDAEKGEVVCPCHLSRFDSGGRVLNPPAQSDLSAYPVKIQHGDQTLSIDLGDSAFPAAVDGLVTFTLEGLPALQTVGGSVTGHSPGVRFPLIVVRTAAAPATDSLSAFNAHCTHLGCAVYGTGSQLLICKCHGSLFDAGNGKAKLGPATMPLVKLTVVSFDGATAVVKVA